MQKRKTDKKPRVAAARSKRNAELERLALEEASRIDREVEESRVANPRKLGVLHDAPELELGRRLAEVRRVAGFTQGELAEHTKRTDHEGSGISGAVISLYERGINRPGPKEIRVLCEALRITPNYLIYGDEDPFENRTERARFGGFATTDSEFIASLTYCFTRLHHHHRLAIMQLMMGLLRGWEKSFDTELDANANKTFLKLADDLRLLLASRRKKIP